MVYEGGSCGYQACGGSTFYHGCIYFKKYFKTKLKLDMVNKISLKIFCQYSFSDVHMRNIIRKQK